MSLAVTTKSKSKNYYYVVIASFCLAIQALATTIFGMVFAAVLVCSAFSVLFLVSQILVFNSEEKLRPPRLLAVRALAVGAVLLTLLQFDILFSKGYHLAIILHILGSFGVFAFLFGATLLPLLLGMDILRKYKGKVRALGFMLIAFSVFVVPFFFFGGLGGLTINDATYITFHAARALVSGANPYALNYSGIYPSLMNGSINSLTTTTSGRVLSVFVYPPLYLIFSAPFVLAANSIHALVRVLLNEDVCFTLILLAVIAYFGKGMKREALLGLIVLLSFIFFGLISLIDVLVLIILMVAYLSNNRWYFGILLGLAAATHQLAWPPVILLLVYSIARSKPKKALLDVGTTALTILAASSYFLAIGPVAYFKDMFLSLYGVLPYGPVPLGFIFLKYYQLPLHFFNIMFYLVLAMCVIAYVYMGKRRNLAILSFLPMMVLSVGRPEYYLFYIILGALIFALSRKEPKQRALKGARFAYAAIGVLAVLLIAVVLYGHARYSSNFGISVSSPVLTNASNSMTYSASFRDAKGPAQLRYLIYYFNANDEVTVATWSNSSVAIRAANGTVLFTNTTPPGESDNLIDLPSGLASAARSITIRSLNLTAGDEECAIYNESYFYICPPAATR